MTSKQVSKPYGSPYSNPFCNFETNPWHFRVFGCQLQSYLAGSCEAFGKLCLWLRLRALGLFGFSGFLRCKVLQGHGSAFQGFRAEVFLGLLPGASRSEPKHDSCSKNCFYNRWRHLTLHPSICRSRIMQQPGNKGLPHLP